MKLDKALYGYVQSARLWYDNFSEFLQQQGYGKNEKDLCVFNKHNVNGVQYTVSFHVHDVMVTSENESMLDAFEEVTEGKYENVSVT